jgi:phenylacetate-CoA ligase
LGMFAVPCDRALRLHASSGTTRKPTLMDYTAKDTGTLVSCVARAMRASGMRPGGVASVSCGCGLFTGGLGPITVPKSGWTVVPRSAA